MGSAWLKSEGSDQEDRGSRPAQAKSACFVSSKPWVQTSLPQKKKKKKGEGWRKRGWANRCWDEFKETMEGRHQPQN
jgi:hypothetical protein